MWNLKTEAHRGSRQGWVKSGEEKDAFGYLGDICSRDLLHNIVPYGLDAKCLLHKAQTLKAQTLPQAVVGGEAF